MVKPALSILIADDDDGDRKQIRRALKQAGFDVVVTEASDGAEAIAACEGEEFDCAFVDYLMPGQTGLDSVARLHALRPHMPIVMVTGEGDEMIASEAIKRGAVDYVAKRMMTGESIARIVAGALERASLMRKVAQAREELESFARVLVHDLRAPLRTIKSFAGLVDESIKAGDIDTIQEDWSRVVGAAERMDHLIQSLHLYTQADAEAATERVAMTDVAEDTRSNLDFVIRERGAQLRADPLPVVAGDRALLTQLLQNLIANGIKYCEAPTPEVHVGADRAESLWRLTVTDNGIGIPEEHRKVIFLPFKRLHAKGEFAGTGLGLATCRRIVERHGGEIWCDAADPGGSAFRFTLPAWTDT